MSWNNYGAGAGVYRSGVTMAETVQTGNICDILEELRTGINERLGITSIAPLAAFETGEGLTYAQAKAAVAALKTKIESGLASFYADWPPVTGFANIGALLTLGSYGTSWLTFERLQDGRVYEQIREAIDAIVCVRGSIGTIEMNSTTGAGDGYKGSYPVKEDAHNAALSECFPTTAEQWRVKGSNIYIPYPGESGVQVRPYHNYTFVNGGGYGIYAVLSAVAVESVASPLFRVSNNLRIVPTGWAGRLCLWSECRDHFYPYTSNPIIDGCTFTSDMSISVGATSVSVSAGESASGTLYKYVDFGANLLLYDDDYLYLPYTISAPSGKAINLSGSDPDWPLANDYETYSVYCDIINICVYDNGTTWTKKP